MIPYYYDAPIPCTCRPAKPRRISTRVFSNGNFASRNFVTPLWALPRFPQGPNQCCQVVGNQLLMWPGGTAIPVFLERLCRPGPIDALTPVSPLGQFVLASRLSSAEYQPVRNVASFIFLSFLAFRRSQQITLVYQLASAFFFCAPSWRFL